MAIYEREVVAMIMYGYGNDSTYNLVVIILGICVGLLLMICYGYLFNYYIIKELREMNRNIKDLNDTLGSGLKNVCMSNQAQPKQHYQMRNNGGQQGLNNNSNGLNNNGLNNN